ncbi:MAG: hypothetical protein LBM97_01330 [Candidatus Nomurabacteria bacterium]|jgi:mRNA interferase RelE/StbE|nr:hypothetical protein [Candidatus Nomurabacteria bacterium]
MTDRTSKFLAKLSQKQRLLIENLLLRIRDNDLAGLDVKKMAGFDDVFRVRKGEIRIVFWKSDDFIRILAVEFRGNVYGK